MTIQADPSQETYAGDGVTVAFAIPFPFDTAADIKVILTDSVGEPTAIYTGFSITGGSGSTGTLTLEVAPAADEFVTVLDDPALTQPADYTPNDSFPAEAHEGALDRTVRQVKRQAQRIERSVRVADGDALDGDDLILPPVTERAGRVLAFDSNGELTTIAAVADIGDIAVPVEIASGGTGADNRSDALSNLGLIDTVTEVSITGAIALDGSALGRAFVISGSTPFTVSLPSSAPVGSLIMLRIAHDATNLYTMSGVDVGIDGSASRIMWRGESCLLRRSASSWNKVGGRSIPFRGCLIRTAAQTFSEGSTFVAVDFQDEVGDQTTLDLCFNSADGRFVAPRGGSWQFHFNASLKATVGSAAATADIALAVNSGSTSPTTPPSTAVSTAYPVGASRIGLITNGVVPLNAGHHVEAVGRIIAGGGGTAADPQFEYSEGVIAASLSYIESPVW